MIFTYQVLPLDYSLKNNHPILPGGEEWYFVWSLEQRAKRSVILPSD